MNPGGWIGKTALALAVLVPIIGLGLSIYLAATGAPEPKPAGAAPDSGYVLTAGDFPAAEVGNRVGYRVPDFTLTLADGSTVTSASLVEAQQPTYLFFWATI